VNREWAIPKTNNSTQYNIMNILKNTRIVSSLTRLVLAVVALGFLVSGDLQKASAYEEGGPVVKLHIQNGQYWVTCVRPAAGRAMLAVRVELESVRTGGFTGTGRGVLTATLPLRNFAGAETEARRDPFGGIYRGRVVSVQVMR
jgi:hypothetical protein